MFPELIDFPRADRFSMALLVEKKLFRDLRSSDSLALLEIVSIFGLILNLHLVFNQIFLRHDVLNSTF